MLYLRIKVFASLSVLASGYFTLDAGFISKMSNICSERSFSSIQVDISSSFKSFFPFPTAPSMPLQAFETISFSTPLVVEITTSFLLLAFVLFFLLLIEPDLLKLDNLCDENDCGVSSLLSLLIWLLKESYLENFDLFELEVRFKSI